MAGPGGYRGAEITTTGLEQFSKEMKRLDKELGKAVRGELKETGEAVKKKIAGSTAAPFAATAADDSGGANGRPRPGRKRRSVKVSVTQKGVALRSREPDAAVWNWGGVIKPRGVPIVIPRTEWMTKAVSDSGPEVEQRLEHLLIGTAERYAGFH